MKSMIKPDKAWDIVVGHTSPLPVFQQDLAKCLHHVLAEPIVADRDIPPADRSAMDGYAVLAADIRTVPVDLTVCGEVAAGSDAAPEISPGKCARIFTGGNLPPGSDTVVMVEDTEDGRRCEDAMAGRGGQESVTFLKTVEKGANIFKRAENAREGEVLIEAGTFVNSAHMGVCAAVGRSTLKVHRKPAVSILATGEELLNVGAEAKPHQLRNSNGPVLTAALQSRGYEVVAGESVADDLDVIVERIREALEASDIVVLTGGVSVGKYDLVPEAVAQAGGTIHYHGVAMKPGRPQLFATSSEGKCIFGLPGNPLSAMTGFYEFVLPSLHRLAGLPPASCRPILELRLVKDIFSKGERRRYVLGKVLWNAEGGPAVEPVESHGTADLVAGGKADGTIMIPDTATKLTAGSVVDFRPWRFLLVAVNG